MTNQTVAIPCVLVAKLPSGVRVPAIRTQFPDYETDRKASSFPNEEEAKRFVRILRALGAEFEIELEIDIETIRRANPEVFSL